MALQGLDAAGTTWSANDWSFGSSSQYPTLRRYTENSSGDQVEGLLFCYQPTGRIPCGVSQQIRTIEDLNAVRYRLDGDYELANDLDFSDEDSYVGAVTASYTTSTLNAVGFPPIGTEEAPFTGTLDGGDFVIANLFIRSSSNPVAGLFGVVEGATISDLGLEDVDISVFDALGPIGRVSIVEEGDTIVYINGMPVTKTKTSVEVDGVKQTVSLGGGGALIGAVAGSDDGTVLTNVYATGSVSGRGSSFTVVGGLVGINEYSALTISGGSYADVDVTIDEGVAGGLIGYSGDSLVITDSYTTGDVFSRGFETARSGGLVGSSASLVTITDSYTTGDVQGGEAGGLIGFNFSIAGAATITDSYTTGTVYKGRFDGNLGGLVGFSTGGELTISGSYTTGDLDNSEEATTDNILNTNNLSAVSGGLIGINESTTSITESYSEGSIGGSYAGGLVGINRLLLTISDGYSEGDFIGSSIGGLVARNDGTLTITGGYATGSLYALGSRAAVGGLVGENLVRSVLRITNSYTTGDITTAPLVGGKASGGGLVGYTSRRSVASIRNSYTEGLVEAPEAGGLVGSANGELSITNAYAAGVVLAPARKGYAGGLVGRQGNALTITNGLSTGLISARGDSSSIGGLVGFRSGDFPPVLSGSYWNATSARNIGAVGVLTGIVSTVSGATAQTEVALLGLTLAEATGWSANDWDFGTASQYPSLRSYEENNAGDQVVGTLFADQPCPRGGCPTVAPTPTLPVIEIRTIEDLYAVRNALDRDYVLMNDLDFDDEASYAGEVNLSYAPDSIAISQSSTLGWLPIGDVDAPFTGTFQGQGFIINHLYVHRPAGFVGLFGVIAGATIRDLVLDDIYLISSADYVGVGGLAGGISEFSILEDCRADGVIIGDGDRAAVGGLVGVSAGEVYNVSSTITNGIYDGFILTVGTGVSIGGLVGLSEAWGLDIRNSFADVDVRALSDSLSAVGGLVGRNAVGGELSITNSYADGSLLVEGLKSFAGGLVGRSAGIRGTVSIVNSYATPSISGPTSGGLLGSIEGPLTVTSSYWDSETTGQATSAGSGGTAQLTTALQGLTDISTGWSTNDWAFGENNEYPSLRDYATNGAGEQIEGEIYCLQPGPRTACVVPTLTPELTAPDTGFTSVNSGVYTVNLGDIVSGGANSIVRYNLIGTNLSKSVEVGVSSEVTAPNPAPSSTPFSTNPALSAFTSLDGTVPSGSSPVAVTFAPPTVQTATTYTYRITYNGGSVAGNVVVEVTANVVPISLTAELTTPGTGFTSQAGGTSTVDLGDVISGSGDSIVRYNLIGANLSTSVAVGVSGTLTEPSPAPSSAPFTINPAADTFTSLDGTVPIGSSPVTVTFAVPAEVASATAYVYSIRYSGGGLAEDLVIEIRANVVPATLTPALTTPADGEFVRVGNRYTYSIGQVIAVAATANSALSYSLTGSGLVANGEVTATTTVEPSGAVFTGGANFTATASGTVVAPANVVSITFDVPDDLATRGIYSYTIVYTGSGLPEGGISVVFTALVVPEDEATLTPTLQTPVGGGFLTTSPTTYSYTIETDLIASATTADFTLSYELLGSNLTVSEAVTATTTTTAEPSGDDLTGLFSGGADFTVEAGGAVPSGSSPVTVTFAVPDVLTAARTYTYTISYTGAGLPTGGIAVVVVANVRPAATLTPTNPSFVASGTATYTLTVDDVLSGSAEREVTYTLLGTNLTGTAVEVNGELTAPSPAPATVPFSVSPSGRFTSLDGTVPSGASPVTVTFAPPVVLTATTYTYTLTYSGGGLADDVVVAVVVNVRPAATLTPTHTSFVTSGTTHRLTFERVFSGGENREVSYTLVGANLTTTAVEAVGLLTAPSATTLTPFSVLPAGGFTSTDGGVPATASSVVVTFVVPEVEEPTTYTYRITYSGGGIVGNVVVELTMNVTPSLLITLTPALEEPASSVFEKSGTTYSFTLDGVIAGSAARTFRYTLVGANLTTAVAAAPTLTAPTPAPTTVPFSISPTGGFTPDNGGVPVSASPLTVTFAVPAVDEATTYTYNIAYSGGGLVSNVVVVLTVNVVPATVGPTPLGVELVGESNGVVLSPNPTSDVLFVRGAASRITLLDVSGHVVLSQPLGAQSSLDVRGLPAGLYVAQITTPEGIITRRLVIQ
ncbi:MAG: T9SS type A sorting domain-containing protein [Gammaproteobacteria bacterium]|nr:T9SS type A sorting domain-containing protein [Gammaproteobacteria bacterium]